MNALGGCGWPYPLPKARQWVVADGLPAYWTGTQWRVATEEGTAHLSGMPNYWEPIPDSGTAVLVDALKRENEELRAQVALLIEAANG